MPPPIKNGYKNSSPTNIGCCAKGRIELHGIILDYNRKNVIIFIAQEIITSATKKIKLLRIDRKASNCLTKINKFMS